MVFINTSPTLGQSTAFLHSFAWDSNTYPAYGPRVALARALTRDMMWSEDISPIPTSVNLLGATNSIEMPLVDNFEVVLPDVSILIGMGSVVVLSIAAGFVWANDVVPVSRTKLAISKSRGDVRQYLDGLRPAITSDIEGETNTNIVQEQKLSNVSITKKTTLNDGREFERWLFSDWLNKPDAKRGRQKDPALPILKDAKWNSGDNPVLVTAAIMLLGIILASITERISS